MNAAAERTECPICKERFAFLGTHIVQKHKIPIQKFKEMYPNVPTISKELSQKLSIKREVITKAYWEKINADPEKRKQRLKNQGRPKNERVKRQCPVCGKVFETHITNKGIPYRKYCSLKCALDASSHKIREMTKTKNPMKDPAIKEKVGKTIKAKFKTDHEYRQKVLEGLKKAQEFLRTHPEKHKNFARMTILKLKSEGKFESWHTKGTIIALIKMRRNYRSRAEKAVKKLLDSLQVTYVENKPVRTSIGTKFPDFIITDKNQKIIIEVDGEWHLKRKDLDKKKDEAFLNLGYSVLRFSSYEAVKYPQLVLEIIKQALDTKKQVYRTWHEFNGKLSLILSQPIQTKITKFC